jgi:hypothetical protein
MLKRGAAAHLKVKPPKSKLKPPAPAVPAGAGPPGQPGKPPMLKAGLAKKLKGMK